MATQLLKKISRQTLGATDSLGRPLIITLLPGDEVQLRAKGKRFSYTVPIQAIYYLALLHSITTRHKERVKEYKLKRKAGIRCRTPKALPRVFNPMLYEALRIK